MKVHCIILFLLALAVSNAATYKITQVSNQKNIEKIRLELNKISDEYVKAGNNDAALREEIANLQQSVDSQKQDTATQNNCIKMNELRQLDSSIVLRTAGESGGNGCGPTEATKMITREIEQTYTYVKGYKENYAKTGMTTWRHNPDLCLYDVNKYWDSIQAQYNEYNRYRGLCSQ